MKPAFRLAVAAALLPTPLAAVAQTALPPSTSGDGTAHPATPDNVWLPKQSAEVAVLDKVSTRHDQFTIKVGGSGSFGALTIQVTSCVARPADKIQDAAAFLVLTTKDQAAGSAPIFSAWMFANEPAASMVENPVYDVRVVGCR
jgi:hypothetical protein